MSKYLLIAFLFVFASCTEEQIVPNRISESESPTITSRTIEAVEVDCEVASFEIIIEDATMNLINFDMDISDLAILQLQEIDFLNLTTNEVEAVQVEVTSFEIIIEDATMNFVAPTLNWSNYEIAKDQTLVFE